MKGIWKTLLAMALPLIKAAGQARIDEDSDDIGRDDLIGGAMIYGANLFDAIIRGKELPKAPKNLQ